jgi:hypothetical protein
MENSNNSRGGMQSTVMKLIGIALLWVGLAALAYIPSAAPGTWTTFVAIGGFLSFAIGLHLFADGLKRDVIREIRG